MSRVRVGVIGTGGIASARTAHFSADPNTEIAAIASRSSDKAKEAAERYGCRAAENWQAIVADPEIDAVVVATPNTMHFEHALAALENGKHVEVEYPLCQTLEQADALRSVAEAKGVVLHHGLNVRTEAIYLAAKDALARIGDPVCMRFTYYGAGKWYTTPELVGDMYLALHIHFIDYARGLFGEVKSLVATGHHSGKGDTYSHSGVILTEHENCPSVHIEFGMGYTARPPYTFHILGTDGLITMSGSREIELETADGKSPVEVPKKDNLLDDSENFVARIVRGAAPLREWDDCIRTMRLCLDCTRSSATGEKIAY